MKNDCDFKNLVTVFLILLFFSAWKLGQLRDIWSHRISNKQRLQEYRLLWFESELLDR